MQDLYKLLENSKYFNSNYYLENNEDVASAGLDPIMHYMAYGFREGRNPSAEFDNDAYLAKYKDARDMNIAPLLHYEGKGKYQRRSLTDVLTPIVREKEGNKANNKVIYTCISGDYISLFNHRYTDHNWDYIAFTDNEELITQKTHGIWQIRPLPMAKLEDRKNARYVKIQAHTLLQDYDYSLWVDGNIDILSPTIYNKLEEFIEKNVLIAISQHEERDCIYDEAETCKLHLKDDEATIDKHMQILINAGYPKHNGLFNTATMLRRHNDKDCIRLMDAWWYMVKNHSKRDQLSLCYAAWKENIHIEKYFDIPTLEMYYDYIQTMQGFLHVKIDPITGEKTMVHEYNR